MKAEFIQAAAGLDIEKNLCRYFPEPVRESFHVSARNEGSG